MLLFKTQYNKLSISSQNINIAHGCSRNLKSIRLWCIHAMGYCSATKMNELWIPATTRKNLKGIMLSG